jgi:hypothetical protein
MTLSEATTILRNPQRGEQGMDNWSAAGAYLASYYRRHPEKMRAAGPAFTKDAKRRTRDQYEPGSEGALEAPGEVGPTIVMTLPGPITRYALFEQNGQVVLVDQSDIDEQLDPGTVQTADRQAINARVAAEQAANQAFADRITKAWKVQANG